MFELILDLYAARYKHNLKQPFVVTDDHPKQTFEMKPWLPLLSIENRQGYTPLTLAAKLGRKEVGEQLIKTVHLFQFIAINEP